MSKRIVLPGQLPPGEEDRLRRDFLKQLDVKAPPRAPLELGELRDLGVLLPDGRPASELQYAFYDMRDQRDRDRLRGEVLECVRGRLPELAATPSRRKQARRVMHFIPGHEDRFLVKAGQLGFDTLILDLEDSVPASMKEAARQNIVAFDKRALGGRELCVRINFGDPELFEADMKAVNKCQPDLVMVPKLKSRRDLDEVRRRLNYTPEFFAIIETIESYHNAREIIMADGVTAAVFGGEDLYADMSVRERRRRGDIVAKPLDQSTYLGYIRPLVSVCVEKDIQFIDCVHTLLPADRRAGDAAVDKHLEDECRISRSQGCMGKVSIHPSQIDIIRDGFDVSPREVQYAMGKLRQFDSKTAVVVERSKMQDTPEVVAARRILRDALRYL
ncbi:MAG: CoA ester lyase [Candidatus Altiarchaeota archaeon]|nr:CoA ester lyase [Candidatus Altiarchaeota archaeon]